MISTACIQGKHDECVNKIEEVGRIQDAAGRTQILLCECKHHGNGIRRRSPVSEPGKVSTKRRWGDGL